MEKYAVFLPKTSQNIYELFLFLLSLVLYLFYTSIAFTKDKAIYFNATIGFIISMELLFIQSQIKFIQQKIKNDLIQNVSIIVFTFYAVSVCYYQLFQNDNEKYISLVQIVLSTVNFRVSPYTYTKLLYSGWIETVNTFIIRSFPLVLVCLVYIQCILEIIVGSKQQIAHFIKKYDVGDSVFIRFERLE